jgi:peptidoglycan/LPS O-acetylase OafA/YrhL
VRFAQVDALRAIAALSVFVFHAADKALVGTPIATYTSRLDVGVTLFFVISGFLLYRPFVAARLRSDVPAPEAGRYAWHRVLRIVPAYWVALTVSTIVLGRPGVLGRDAIVYYGFGQVYSLHTLFGGIGQAWTLSVEVAFYVFLPLWAWAISHIRRKGARARLRVELVALASLAGFSLLLKPLLAGAIWMDPRLRSALSQSLLVYLDQFAVGMALAALSVWFENHRPPRAIEFVSARPWLPWAAAAVAFWVIATQLGLKPWALAPQTSTQRFEVHCLGAVVAFGLILPAVLGQHRRGAIQKALRWRPLLWIGTVSYGLYLWHSTVLVQLGRWGVPADVVRATGIDPLIVWMVLGIVPSLALAAGSWYGIERIVLRRKDAPMPRWVRRLTASGPAAFRGSRRLPAMGLGAVVAVLLASAIIGAGGGLGTITATAGVSNQWDYVAGTYDGHELRLYENGKQIGSTAATGVPGPSSAAIEVGHFIGANRWSGPLDVAVYRKALPPTVILNHYRAGVARWPDYASPNGRGSAVVSTWRGGIRISHAGQPAGPGRPGDFSVEAWARTYVINERAVATQPGAWLLQTGFYGHWIFAVSIGDREIHVTSPFSVPRAAGPT